MDLTLFVWSKLSYKYSMYHGQFFGKIVHEILPLSNREKKIADSSVDSRRPWTIVHETYKTQIFLVIILIGININHQ